MAASRSVIAVVRRVLAKRLFAKRVSRFANRVVGTAGGPLLLTLYVAVAAMATLAGAFDTAEMPWRTRAAFWSLLIGWNVAKWRMWFFCLPPQRTNWRGTVAVGTVLLNLPVPFEVATALRAVGQAAPVRPVKHWLDAVAISAATIAVIAVALRRRRAARAPAGVVAAPRLLARAGVAVHELLAIEAEDHYCRLHLVGGRSVLLHHRFGDALSEVAAIDGAQVHRGAWAANAGVRGARREGRHWRLVLTSGVELPVSAGRAAEARGRGWLRRLPGPIAKPVAIDTPLA